MMEKVLLEYGSSSEQGEGDTRIKQTPVLFQGEQIGTLVQLGRSLISWTPTENKHGVRIAALSDFNQDSLMKTVQAVVERQHAKLATGEVLTEQDTNALDPELQDHLEESEGLGTLLKHPLVFAVPFTPNLVAYYNSQLWAKQAAVREAIEKRDWGRYIALHERPYRLHAFIEIVDEVDDPTYWTMVGNWWTDSENIHQNFEEWMDLWSADRLDRESAMDDEERVALAVMPEILTIYRGYQVASSKLGMSWTLDRQQAKWFANRFRRPNNTAWIATAKIYKTDVLAYFTGRSEEEIVVLPDDVFDVRVEQVPG